MLFPTLSVTSIGLVVGGVVAAGLGHPVRPLAIGILGAWIGFAAGAIVGVGIDVVLGSGIWVAIIGHAGAVTGATAATRSRLIHA